MVASSYDDFSPLKEILIGSAAGYRDRIEDVSFDMFVSDNVSGTRGYYPSISTWRDSDERGRRNEPRRLDLKRRFIEELHEDVELLCSTLRTAGVSVLRPLPIPSELREVSTPAWSARVTPPLNLRDGTLVLGEEIVETPPMLRDRYFEGTFLRPYFEQHARSGGRWTVMPRPVMTDSSYDPDNLPTAAPNIEAPDPVIPSPFDVGLEAMIDAANCVRLGRDLLVNVANRNHAAAFSWLERHLAGRVDVWRLDAVTQSHIDSVIVPLRPGLLLLRHEGIRRFLPPWLQRWDVVVPPEPTIDDYPQYDGGYPIRPSPYVDLNLLSIDESTVVVNESCHALVQMLEGRGFTVVPVRHRHRRLFGGGFHCFSLDTRRSGGNVVYR